MTLPTNSQPKTFGYLVVVEDELHGFTGGLLVVCDRGRPLEFHCTEPVRPSRAQQILFGPTLREYVCGEQIGGALLSKAKVKIDLLLTLDAAAATAGAAGGVAALVLAEGDPTPDALATLSSVVDPTEPFERVREAIREAQRLVAGGDERAAA